MNGEEDYGSPEPTFQSSTPSVFGDFANAATAKFSEITERFRSAPTSTDSAVGGSIFNALYAFGAGRVEQARTQLVSGFLGTGTGKKLAAEAEKQRMQQWMPLIIGGVAVLLIAGFAFGRR